MLVVIGTSKKTEPIIPVNYHVINIKEAYNTYQEQLKILIDFQ